MPIRYTRQGCRIETTYQLAPNGTYTENVVLSVEPDLSLAPEEGARALTRIQVNLPYQYRS